MKKVSLTLILVTIFCLVFAGLAMAKGGGGTTGTITGIVKDIATGAAISGVTISNGSASATTNSSGSFTLTAAAGSNTLSATATGYQTTWQICTVTANTTTTVNWSLTKAYGTQTIPAASMNYVILAWNDLGMH